MNFRLTLVLSLCLLVSAFAHPAVAGTDAEVRAIRVELFGQPCELRGPLEVAELQALHAVSPAALPAEPLAQEPETGPPLAADLPVSALTQRCATLEPSLKRSEQARAELERELATRWGLERYLATQGRRVAALQSVCGWIGELAAGATPPRPSAAQLAARGRRVSALLKPHFDTRVARVLAASFSRKHARLPNERLSTAWLVELQDAIAARVPTAIDDEFHRGLKTHGVRYECSYGDEVSEEQADPAAVNPSQLRQAPPEIRLSPEE